MVKSLPSTKIVFVDVPEVKNFQGEYGSMEEAYLRFVE